MKKTKKWKTKTRKITPSIQEILHGDCFEQTRILKPNSLDALICDPPAGISIIGKDWDSDLGGAHKWIKWMETLFMEIHRVLKPGAHGLVWALPRTSHWTATALENAGFEIRDVVNHLFGSGFPKSQNMAKAIDKHFGVEPEVVATRKGTKRPANKKDSSANIPMNTSPGDENGQTYVNITRPVTRQAARWDGWGSGLKPSSENWILVRKPLSGSIVDNVLKWGTGALNIDGCRIGTPLPNTPPKRGKGGGDKRGGTGIFQRFRPHPGRQEPKGRWPANLVLSHHPECYQVGLKEVRGTKGCDEVKGKKPVADSGLLKGKGELGYRSGHADENGFETVEDWCCHPECPVRIMDEQSGTSTSTPMKGGGIVTKRSTWAITQKGGKAIRAGHDHNDSGGASRFFYCAKPSVAERNAGCEALDEKVAGGYEFNQDGSLTGHVTMSRNTHPTVKPIALMKYLIKMITPHGGTVFDPFAGSGTTLLAARELGLNAIGIEREAEYVQIIKARLGSCGAATGRRRKDREAENPT